MAISRVRKDELLTEYRQQVAQSAGLLMANYKALTVPQLEDIRRRVREQEGQVFVVKNTLFKLVLGEQTDTVPDDFLVGPTLVAFCHQDIAPVAKLFRDVVKEFEDQRFTVSGAYMTGQLLDASQALALADLPSREELLAQVLRTINAPATQMVGVLNNAGGKDLVGVMASGVRQVVNVVKAYVTKLEESGAAA